jgi:chromosome partitioning protein
MDVITLASRKGGAGKSTLTAQLAAQAQVAGKRVLVIDADPQGSLKLWHSRRAGEGLKLVTPERGLERAIAFAMIEGFDTVFIDTAPTMWVVVQEAIRAATLVLIPARPGFFDLDAVRETVKTAAERNKPYAVVINAAPVRRDDKDTSLVAQSRAYFDSLGVPVWAGPDQPARRIPVDVGGRRERRGDRPAYRGRRGDRGTVARGRAFDRCHQCRPVRAGTAGERRRRQRRESGVAVTPSGWLPARSGAVRPA